jgi:hypothetical protein
VRLHGMNTTDERGLTLTDNPSANALSVVEPSGTGGVVS